MTDLLARLNGVSRSGDGWTAHCPAHEDRHNSLSIHNRDGRWLIKRHAGCEWEEIIGALGLDASALFDGRTEGRLHQDCQAAWAADRDLDIPSYLDGRGTHS